MSSYDYQQQALQNQMSNAQDACQVGLASSSNVYYGQSNFNSQAYSCQAYSCSPFPIKRGDSISISISKPKLTKKEDKSMFKQFQEYIATHRDIVFSIVLIALADRVFFNGVLQEKIASLVHKLVESLERKVNKVTDDVRITTEAK